MTKTKQAEKATYIARDYGKFVGKTIATIRPLTLDECEVWRGIMTTKTTQSQLSLLTARRLSQWQTPKAMGQVSLPKRKKPTSGPA